MPIALSQRFQRFIANVPLRWALTIPFVLPTIGAVALVGYLSHRSGQEAVEDLAHQFVAGINERVTQELKTYLQTPFLINRLNVDAANQRQLDLQNIPSLKLALLTRFRQFDQIRAILFANPEGKLIAVEKLSTLRLAVADPAHPNEIRVYSLDQQGKPGQLVERIKNADVQRDRPWYQRAATTGKPGWNPIAQSGSTKVLTLNVSHPVYDQVTQRLLGVFSTHVRLRDLSEVLYHFDISRFGRVIITDRNSTLIATSTREPLYKVVAGTGFHQQFKRVNLRESQDDLTRSLGKSLRDRPDFLKIDQPQSLEFIHNGELQYTQITPFRDPDGLSWQILVVIPRSHFMGVIEENQRTTILLSLLTLGVAISLGLFATNRLLARFAQLNRVSGALAQGKLDQRLPTDSAIYELNALSNSFNQMADQLQQSFNRIQAALAESEEKFTTIFRTSLDPIAIASLEECRILEVNHSLLELFAYSRVEVIGRTPAELNLWSNPEEHAQYRTSLEKAGHVHNLEVQLCTKLGEVKTVLLSAEIRALERQDCVIVMFRDISARKQMEEALRQSEARYRAIVEDQTELITRFLPDTTLLFVNDAYCRYFDIHREAVIGKRYSPNIDESDRDWVAQLVQSVSIDNPTIMVENRVVVNGATRWTQWISRTLFDEEGNVTEIQAVGRDITELKQTEAALRQSETRFRQLAETVQEGFFVFETESAHYSYLNPACEAMTGPPEPARSEEKPYAKGMSHWLNNIHPDDRDRIEERLCQERLGNNFDEEYRFIRPNGEIRWLRSQAFPIRNDRGEVVRIVGTVNDITDRKQLQLALQNSEAKLKKLLNSANASIASFRLFPNRQWEYEYWSEGCEVVFGYTAQEFLAVPSLWFSRVFPEDIEQGRVVNLESFMTDYPTTAQGEYRFFHKDGSVHWSSFQATARPEGSSGWLVTVVDVDITDRKLAEESLRENEEQFRRSFDDAPIGISLVSPAGQFLKVNNYYSDLLGYTQEELLSLKFQDITHPADLEKDIEGFQQMLAGELCSFEMQKRYVTKQGASVPVLMHTALIRDHNQQPLYFVGHIQNIRDRLAVERMKDEFISIMSHELRTPLTSIRGALDLLASGVYDGRPEKANRMLTIAISNSDRLVRLVNDILDLERLGSGKVRLVKQQCQVADLMQQAVDSVQAIADQSGITLSLAPVAAILPVAPDAIMQTLTNLLSNAIKFSPLGSTVWLQAELRRAEWEPERVSVLLASSPSPYILFSIKDQGRGIPADKLESIFEQFQQVDVSDSRKKGGTGLGLAICKRIVQQHGGTIWAESTFGQGSTFYFTLPLVEKGEND